MQTREKHDLEDLAASVRRRNSCRNAPSSLLLVVDRVSTWTRQVEKRIREFQVQCAKVYIRFSHFDLPAVQREGNLTAAIGKKKDWGHQVARAAGAFQLPERLSHAPSISAAR